MASEPTAQTCPACGTAVETVGAEPLVRIPCPNCGKKLRVKRTFDHFLVVETLGVGGMGTVYKARDTQLDRFVALKLLRRDLGGEENYDARLQREARIAASVNHPHVIQVFDSGTDHGQFYVVMELVDRGSLDDLMAVQSRLPEKQVLEIGIQVARGLRAALRRGLIHRDVKPANILFSDEQAAKIGDFGLASVATQRSETDSAVWGTPHYVAPERLSNQAEDFRGDIYSLGATLFHAVAGTPPIDASTNSAAALHELKQRPLNLEIVAADVSASTARVLQRMIAPDPGQRFSSYDDLVTELESARRDLENPSDSDAPAHSRQPLWTLPRFSWTWLEPVREFLRESFRWSVLIRVVLPLILLAAAVFFVLQRGVSRSRADAAALVTSFQERGPWNKALATYKDEISVYHFDQAAETIRNVQLTGTYFQSAREIAEKRARLLSDWKNVLIDNLNRMQYSGAVTDSNGVQYMGIAGATNEVLNMKLPYGIAGVKWQELSPQELLIVSKSFINPGAPDAADRQWRCAVFASETGQTKEAKALVEAAATAKPEYKDQIAQLFPEIR
jgi:serine/threonine protein kinase